MRQKYNSNLEALNSKLKALHPNACQSVEAIPKCMAHPKDKILKSCLCPSRQARMSHKENKLEALIRHVLSYSWALARTVTMCIPLCENIVQFLFGCSMVNTRHLDIHIRLSKLVSRMIRWDIKVIWMPGTISSEASEYIQFWRKAKALIEVRFQIKGLVLAFVKKNTFFWDIAEKSEIRYEIGRYVYVQVDYY